MMRFNTDLNTMEFYNGNEWRQFRYQSDIRKNNGSRGAVFVAGAYDATAEFRSDDFIKFHL